MADVDGITFFPWFGWERPPGITSNARSKSSSDVKVVSAVEDMSLSPAWRVRRSAGSMSAHNYTGTMGEPQAAAMRDRRSPVKRLVEPDSRTAASENAQQSTGIDRRRQGREPHAQDNDGKQFGKQLAHRDGLTGETATREDRGHRQSGAHRCAVRLIQWLRAEVSRRKSIRVQVRDRNEGLSVRILSRGSTTSTALTLLKRMNTPRNQKPASSGVSLRCFRYCAT